MSNTTIPQPHREAPSLMEPLVLIAIGAYFLLYNMGILPSFNWWMIIRFWPLILIFIGANVLVRQLPQPFGSLLSLVVGIVAIATFGYLVFFATAAAPRWNMPFWGEADFKTEQIGFAPSDINEATIKISTDVPGIHLYALEDSQQLIAGEVSFFDELIFATERTGSTASINLDTRGQREFWLFNPRSWRNLGEMDRWEVGLNGRIPTTLDLDLNANASHLDLTKLTLTHLQVVANASRVSLLLPEGDYTGRLETNAGTMDIIFSEQGKQEMLVNISAGNMTLRLPEGREMQLTVDKAVGNLSVENGRLSRISKNEGHEVWQTPNFDTATDPIHLRLDIAAGNVRIYSS